MLTSREGPAKVDSLTRVEVLDMPEARLPILALCLAAFVSRPARLAAEPPAASSPDAAKPVKPSPTSPASTAPARPARSTVTVKIQGLRHDRGTIFVALYDSKRAFAGKKDHAYGATTRPQNRGAVVVLDNVLPGKYAVAFFQDENGNQKLDTNLLGIPTEGFGFSRDAMGKLGPPAFEDAALELPAGPVVVVMSARYY